MAQPQKRRPESARRANRIIQTRTLLLLGVFGVLTFVLLFAKLYHWQITEHGKLFLNSLLELFLAEESEG